MSAEQQARRMIAAPGLLLVAVAALMSGTSTAQSCRYEYFQQPAPELNCDPYGTRLQLHCAARGPLEPDFSLEWFSSNLLRSDEPPVCVTLDPQYSTMSVEIGSGERREVLSTLLTAVIGSSHAEQCFWCAILVAGEPISTTSSNRLCMLDAAAYNSSVPGCSGITPMDLTVVCANETVPHASIHPTATLGPEHSLQQVLSMTPTSSRGSQGAGLARGLYAAVAVCVLFVVVIVLLAVVILFLCMRRECARKLSLRRGGQPVRSQEVSATMSIRELSPVLASAVPEAPCMQSLRASPARSSTPTQRETPREEHDYATLKSQTPAAANPSSTGEVSCDHSDPSDEKPVPAALPVTPPKKPPRSRSREHFYHSLECSSERGNRSNSNSLNRRSITILASQIKDLFDDPNYAATTVQPPAQLGGRDLSRSTPSLVTAGVQLRPPYVWERASFRMVRNTRRVIQKRRSDIVDRDS